MRLFAIIWFPGYIEQTYHVALLKTGGLLTIPWAVGTLFLLFGGWVSDRIYQRKGSSRLARVLPIGVGMLLAGLSFFTTAPSHHLALDLTLLSLGMGFAFFCNAPIFSLNIDLFKENAATAQGIMTALFALSGILSPAITGWLTHRTGSYQAAIFLVGLLSVSAFFIAYFLQREPSKKN